MIWFFFYFYLTEEENLMRNTPMLYVWDKFVLLVQLDTKREYVII